MKGYRAEYAGLRLLVQQLENSVEYTVFEGEAIVWQANAPDVEAGKEAALFEAREWSCHPSPEVLPDWVSDADEPN